MGLATLGKSSAAKTGTTNAAIADMSGTAAV
jgi:hypothetical protein